MNRRRFLTGVGAVALAAALPARSALATPALIAKQIMLGEGRYASFCNGVQSDDAALDLAIQDIWDGGLNPGRVRIHLPTRFAVAKARAGLGGIYFVGEGPVETHCNVVGPIAGNLGRPLFDFSTSPTGLYGGGMQGLSIPTTEHTGGLTLVNMIIPNNGVAPGNTRFADLRLGAGHTGPNGQGTAWLPWRHVNLIGNANTVPAGLREITLERVTVFGCTSQISIYADRMVGGGARDIGAYPVAAGSQVWVFNSFATEWTGLNIQGGSLFQNNVNSRFVTKGGSILAWLRGERRHKRIEVTGRYRDALPALA